MLRRLRTRKQSTMPGTRRYAPSSYTSSCMCDPRYNAVGQFCHAICQPSQHYQSLEDTYATRSFYTWEARVVYYTSTTAYKCTLLFLSCKPRDLSSPGEVRGGRCVPFSASVRSCTLEQYAIVRSRRYTFDRAPQCGYMLSSFRHSGYKTCMARNSWMRRTRGTPSQTRNRYGQALLA